MGPIADGGETLARRARHGHGRAAAAAAARRISHRQWARKETATDDATGGSTSTQDSSTWDMGTAVSGVSGRERGDRAVHDSRLYANVAALGRRCCTLNSVYLVGRTVRGSPQLAPATSGHPLVLLLRARPSSIVHPRDGGAVASRAAARVGQPEQEEAFAAHHAHLGMHQAPLHAARSDGGSYQ